MEKAISKNGVPIRLSNERWLHITTGHPETAGLYFEILETIENPLCVYESNYDELMAVGRIGNIPDKFIVVVYKEISLSDGFVITEYISNKMQSFKKRKLYGSSGN